MRYKNRGVRRWNLAEEREAHYARWDEVFEKVLEGKINNSEIAEAMRNCNVVDWKIWNQKMQRHRI